MIHFVLKPRSDNGTVFSFFWPWLIINKPQIDLINRSVTKVNSIDCFITLVDPHSVKVIAVVGPGISPDR